MIFDPIAKKPYMNVFVVRDPIMKALIIVEYIISYKQIIAQ